MVLVTANEMREMDRRTISEFGIPGRVLMENAGRGAVSVFLERFCDLKHRRVGVLAGRGNNGGDGFVMARYLRQRNVAVTVFLLAEATRVTGDALANLELLAPIGVAVIQLPDREAFLAQQRLLGCQDIWIDAILGTGLGAEVKGYFRDVIEFVNASRCPVFAVDIASGIDSDTGNRCGICIQAFATATFAFAKVGHHLYPGLQATGALDIVDIGIPSHIADTAGCRHELLTAASLGPLFFPRAPDTHKGRTGHLAVIAGSLGKTGAAIMTAGGALRAGAGLVTLGMAAGLHAVAEITVTEAMTWPLPDTGNGCLSAAGFDQAMQLLAGKQALAIGPGLGSAEETRRLVRRVIAASGVPMVIDADGLNALAGDLDALAKAPAPAILTPHPGEMARLTGQSVMEIQKNRVHAARRLSETTGAVVVLKGARTVIAKPDGRVAINPTGNPGMASGGMGDVLTGVIAGLLAQGFSPFDAACAGVYVHGAAADTLASKTPVGYLATDVLHAIPAAMGQIGSAPAAKPSRL
jgi:hydroxyethylthiazole kinase-like uncharacterized protein yjeF